MRDQADQLRQLVRDTLQSHPSLAPGLPLLVVSGGKGGVGTSTLCIELARQFALLGQTALLVDANPLQPDLASQLNLSPREGLAEVLDGSRSAREVLLEVNDSIRLLPGRWAPSVVPEMNRSALGRLLVDVKSLVQLADLAILDAGSGMNPWIQQLWLAAEHVLLVTTPEPIAVMDSYAAIKLSPWENLSNPLQLVVNHCQEEQQAAQVFSRISSTCQRFLGQPLEQLTPAGLFDEPGSTAFSKSVRRVAADLMSEGVFRAITSTIKRTAEPVPEKNAHHDNFLKI